MRETDQEAQYKMGQINSKTRDSFSVVKGDRHRRNRRLQDTRDVGDGFSTGSLLSGLGPVSVADIRIEAMDVSIEQKAVVLDERSASVFKYRTPHFKAHATVTFPPLQSGEMWKLGWIQACTRMEFHNTYGDAGYSSWEFPELLSREKPMISDSDGNNFPWYGSKSELALIRGPQRFATTHCVHMNDNFHPHITWALPTSSSVGLDVDASGGGGRRGANCSCRRSVFDPHHQHQFTAPVSSCARLTSVKRNQKFLTWLVAMDVLSGCYVVLRTYRWQMKLKIAVDPSRPLGERATLVDGNRQQQPEALAHNMQIPNCALYPHNANGCQQLVWRSHSRCSPNFALGSSTVTAALALGAVTAAT